MRRALALFALGAALLAALPAAAALEPLRPPPEETLQPRIRAGTIRIPPGQASGRIRVIARLQLPPLAAEFGRTIAAAGVERHLNVASRSSRAYLARLTTVQARDAAELRTAIPSARIGLRFRILLDGLTLTLPARRLPQLVRLPFVTHVYPSLRFTEELDRSPSVIGADVVHETLGARGEGIKIAIVDDGIDQTNPFFDPTGFQYPSGFPKGATKWTTPKVIVARVFPGPGSGRPGRLAVDPNSSFHGTHVAGIAAGDANTTAPAGADHPEVTGLSGIAPKAWLGNYRVFTVPTPIGHVANTPQIIAAFEAAVADGMNVINFSGGGPQTDPANDALVEAVHNVVAAGVVPVIAAGNDRDMFGNGSAGSPGTAPDAISVAATSSPHVFAPALSVAAPGAPDDLEQIPFLGAAGTLAPAQWAAEDQRLVDVGTIVGRDGKPVDRHLCGPPGNMAAVDGELPPHSLDGSIALVERGLCPFATKAAQAHRAGAVGLIVADNRQGEANEIPIQLEIPSGMIANLDAEHLIAFMAQSGGMTTITVGREPLEDVTGRSGIITSFSSSGPTAFGHLLKPDISAPGEQILSSTLPRVAPSRFAVFDGTSMATPHIAGSAALLLQLHPTWTPEEVKSALMSTAGPAWGDTARTQEAPVPLEGSGLANVPRAANPLLFTDPASLSFGDLDASRAAASDGLLVQVSDAGGGDGNWQVSLAPQSATSGTSVDVPGTISIPPGGEADLPVVAHAAAGAPKGEDYGFVELSRGGETRRIPYLFIVRNPGLALDRVLPLRRFQAGDTRFGASHVDAYRYPTAPFGNAPDTPPMVEDGAEKVYRIDLNAPAANLGVSVVLQSPGARIDPFLLGSLDEDDVQGDAGTPVDVNELTFDSGLPIGAAATNFPRQQSFYVAVDSGREAFTNRSLAGQYVLRSWINDVTPPTVHLLTARVAAGRPTIAVRATDSGAGVDPYSFALGYGGVLVAPAAYDPLSGIAVFPLPGVAPKLKSGRLEAILRVSDFEEAKNVDTTGTSILPNTRFKRLRIRVVAGPTASWLAPDRGVCVAAQTRLVVDASSSARVRVVRFRDGSHRIGSDRVGVEGLYAVTWRTKRAHAGRHVLSATVVDARGRAATVSRTVRVCRG